MSIILCSWECLAFVLPSLPFSRLQWSVGILEREREVNADFEAVNNNTTNSEIVRVNSGSAVSVNRRSTSTNNLSSVYSAFRCLYSRRSLKFVVLKVCVNFIYWRASVGLLLLFLYSIRILKEWFSDAVSSYGVMWSEMNK